MGRLERQAQLADLPFSSHSYGYDTGYISGVKVRFLATFSANGLSPLTRLVRFCRRCPDGSSSSEPSTPLTAYTRSRRAITRSSPLFVRSAVLHAFEFVADLHLQFRLGSFASPPRFCIGPRLTFLLIFPLQYLRRCPSRLPHWRQARSPLRFVLFLRFCFSPAPKGLPGPFLPPTLGIIAYLVIFCIGVALQTGAVSIAPFVVGRVVSFLSASPARVPQSR